MGATPKGPAHFSAAGLGLSLAQQGNLGVAWFKHLHRGRAAGFRKLSPSPLLVAKQRVKQPSSSPICIIHLLREVTSEVAAGSWMPSLGSPALPSWVAAQGHGHDAVRRADLLAQSSAAHTARKGGEAVFLEYFPGSWRHGN